jgi:transposase InsO family protein
MVQLLVDKRAWLREQGWDAGALSVHQWLVQEGITTPAARTIHRIFVRAGLIEPQPKKRPRSSWRRFEADAPNGCWQMDGTKWRLSDGTSVIAVRLIDDHSRKLMASLACISENSEAAWACLQVAITRHGRPAMFLSDGGAAFTLRRIHGSLSEFEARLRHLGILPVVSSPSHPQTCGKKEREWQTLKRWLRARPAAADLAAFQSQIDAYDLVFNHQRPHQANQGRTPDQRYTASPKAHPAGVPLSPPMTLRNVKTGRDGVINIGSGQQMSIGTQWAHARVDILREDPAIAVFCDNQLVTFCHLAPGRQYQLQPKR